MNLNHPLRPKNSANVRGKFLVGGKKILDCVGKGLGNRKGLVVDGLRQGKIQGVRSQQILQLPCVLVGIHRALKKTIHPPALGGQGRRIISGVPASHVENLAGSFRHAHAGVVAAIPERFPLLVKNPENSLALGSPGAAVKGLFRIVLLVGLGPSLELFGFSFVVLSDEIRNKSLVAVGHGRGR